MLTSARANRDSGPRLRRVDPAPLRLALRTAMDENGGQEVVPLGIEVRQRLVLGALIDEFGGEASVTALTRFLSHHFGWTPPAPGPGLIEVLRALLRLGAISLEANGQSDFIVRLLPDGTRLCD